MEVPESIMNKAAFGELTLGEVWGFVGKMTQSILVEGEVFKWGPYDTIRFVPRLRLELFSNNVAEEDGEPDYSFDLSTKVTVKKDRLEFLYEDKYGNEEKIALHFLFHPKPQPISMEFFLPKAAK